jgi:hypothetical protein
VLVALPQGRTSDKTRPPLQLPGGLLPQNNAQSNIESADSNLFCVLFLINSAARMNFDGIILLIKTRSAGCGAVHRKSDPDAIIEGGYVHRLEPRISIHHLLIMTLLRHRRGKS